MTYQVKFLSSVFQEYLEAVKWYEEQKEGLGLRFETMVEKKINQISLAPEVFSQKTKKGYRDAVVDFFPYIITYKIVKKDSEVLIVSIIHQKKHIAKRSKKY
ncbi:MAG: type II toxin-antitoxin system RelE/ParE family toxin [Pseudobacter sp.]|uniref:type II toxin-antitoxin system RelE/ParE family toxin n=1 Tax=Pseudobacter sp. TaxID=2045420 RepID=UPI003F7FD2F9